MKRLFLARLSMHRASGFSAIVFVGLCFALLPAAVSQGSSSQPSATAAPDVKAGKAQAQPEANANTAEISAHDQLATFKVNVKLVVVRAVVRDANGNAVGNLTKEDFQVFDKGKPQVISQFEVERPGDFIAKARQSEEVTPGATAPAPKTAMPERFIAYLFDDVHLQFGDLARIREAAQRSFATLRPTDRAAVFTTSGQTMLDYTDDRTQLRAALLRLASHPIASSGSHGLECPEISYYQADLIFNKQDPEATSVAMQEALTCPATLAALAPGESAAFANTIASNLVQAAVQQAFATGNQETHVSLTVLSSIVRNLAARPGQRTVVLISPGFIAPEMEAEYNDIVDHALRSQVAISTLDARGLFTVDSLGDIADPPATPPPPQKGLFVMAAANANDDLLAVFAEGTGGTFFHNSNNFDEGLRRVVEAPEYSYVLAFTPQNLKLDGSFHPLKVTVRTQPKLAIEARRGYFAPKHFDDPEQEAKREIIDAVYSQEELHNLPVQLRTQFFKTTDQEARLVVLTHVDVQRLRFRKADGRNNDVLTCVSALFNRNGNFVKAMEKTVTMHWKDETLEHKLGSGLTLKSSFDVKPGSYLVRLVVRDSEGQLMSAENGTVEIR